MNNCTQRFASYTLRYEENGCKLEFYHLTAMCDSDFGCIESGSSLRAYRMCTNEQAYKCELHGLQLEIFIFREYYDSYYHFL
jgi:hypothetical protein